MRTASLLAAGLLGLAGCADLPRIAAQQCGNGVVEAPESCDTFGVEGGLSCRPPGTVGACHLDCRRRTDGTRPMCPEGWGCDPQGICLRPTGALVPLPELELGSAHTLLAGDFDGDGRTDVVTREPVDALGRTRVRVHHFDQNGAFQETRAFAKSMATPAVVDLSGDGRSDLVFTESRVGVVLGRTDRSLVPEAFGSYRFHGARVRTLSVLDGWLGNVPPLATLTGAGERVGLYVPDPSGLMRELGGPPITADELAGELASGDIVENATTSPCRELVLAARAATSFWLVDTCTRTLSGASVWRDAAVSWSIPLDPPAAIEGTPLVVDVNGDGHLDVLLSAGGKRYLSRGDGQRLGTATPFLLASASRDPAEIPMPLAAGDFTGDGVVDFVFDNHLLVSRRVPGLALPAYGAVHVNRGAPWTVARIADLNGNGKVDVVAASSAWLGVSFFNGTGTDALTSFEIPTRQPVVMLEVADFDGDLVDDLALVERVPSGGERDTISVAFGSLAGAPLDPVPVARLDEVEQVSQFPDGKLANMMVASTEAVGGEPEGVLAWLEGSGDRVPFAPYQLVREAGGSVFAEAALAVAVGQFVVAGRRDVLAIGAEGAPGAFVNHFWLLPAPLDPANAAVRLGGTLDRRLRPIVADEFQLRIVVAPAVADFDGDGRDEVAWAMPADDDQSCGVTFTAVGPDGSMRPSAGGTIFVDEPCLAPQLATVDADRDGAADVALLTGAPGAPDRKLLVLWNDGQGGFSASSATRLGRSTDSPQQFAVLPAAAQRPLAIAYVTGGEAAIVSATSVPRQFSLPRGVAALQGGTGIVAGDIDGDGVVDLAVAASGDLRILKAELEAP